MGAARSFVEKVASMSEVLHDLRAVGLHLDAAERIDPTDITSCSGQTLLVTITEDRLVG